MPTSTSYSTIWSVLQRVGIKEIDKGLNNLGFELSEIEPMYGMTRLSYIRDQDKQFVTVWAMKHNDPNVIVYYSIVTRNDQINDNTANALIETLGLRKPQEITTPV